MATIAHLPAECVLRILELVDSHKPTLTAASVVCQSWAGPAQSILFRRVDLHSTRQAEAYLAVMQATNSKRLVTRELELDLDRDGVRREALLELLAGQDRLTRLMIQTGLQSIPSSVLCSPALAGGLARNHVCTQSRTKLIGITFFFRKASATSTSTSASPPTTTASATPSRSSYPISPYQGNTTQHHSSSLSSPCAETTSPRSPSPACTRPPPTTPPSSSRSPRSHHNSAR